MRQRPMLDPPVKIQGKKTRIVAAMQPHITPGLDWLGTTGGRWIEPFTGSGAVGFNLAVGSAALFADVNPHLIGFYTAVNAGAYPSSLIRHKMTEGGARLRERGAAYYYEVRDRFNETADPLDLLWLTRCGFNGLMRFNKSGGYNTPYGKNDQKFTATLIQKIVDQVAELERRCRASLWEFSTLNYGQTLERATCRDLIYCDPPYVNTENTYFQAWTLRDHVTMLGRLQATRGRWVVSLWHDKPGKVNNESVRMARHYRQVLIDHRYIVGPKTTNRMRVNEALFFNW